MTGVALAAAWMLSACSAEPRVCTAVLVQDVLQVDVGAVTLPVASVRACLAGACFGPVRTVDGRAWPLPGGVGHLTGGPTDATLTLYDDTGRALTEAEGRIVPTAVPPSRDQLGEACGPGAFAARLQGAEDGASFRQLSFAAA